MYNQVYHLDFYRNNIKLNLEKKKKRTRYDYNLTIMESPKLATDNRFKKYIKSYLWNWTMLNVCSIVAAILKMETGRNFSMSGINSGRWNQAMLNLCGIVEAILKMATGTNFSMSRINSGHYYLPTCQILMISDNVEFLRYCGGHFENGDQ
jgi:putative Mn2+ efflux pump MntP